MSALVRNAPAVFAAYRKSRDVNASEPQGEET